jgi:hypothetical protein
MVAVVVVVARKMRGVTRAKMEIKIFGGRCHGMFPRLNFFTEWRIKRMKRTLIRTSMNREPPRIAWGKGRFISAINHTMISAVGYQAA